MNSYNKKTIATQQTDFLFESKSTLDEVWKNILKLLNTHFEASKSNLELRTKLLSDIAKELNNIDVLSLKIHLKSIKSGTYERTIIKQFESKESAYPFNLALFQLGENFTGRIHSHQALCVGTVVSINSNGHKGHLKENHYTRNPKNLSEARLEKTVLRTLDHVIFDIHGDGALIHQILTDPGVTAVLLHFYTATSPNKEYFNE